MAHPKSKISKQRKRKRRTHYKLQHKNLNLLYYEKNNWNQKRSGTRRSL